MDTTMDAVNATQPSPRWAVAEYHYWQHVAGRRASVHGACPWYSDAERANWKFVHGGWTVYNNLNGTYGCGQPPSKTREEAQALADRLNARIVGVQP